MHGFFAALRKDAPLIDVVNAGSFARASVGTYLSAAATDGSSAFIQQAAINVRRFEFGKLLLEGLDANLIADYNNFSSGINWSAAGAITPAFAPGPDGIAGSASRSTALSGAFGRYNVYTTGAPTSPFVMSVWKRATTPPFPGQTANGNSSINAMGGILTATFVRQYAVHTEAAASFTGIVTDGQNWSAVGGIPAGARDEIVWGANALQRAFPTSVIPSVGGVSSRAPDVLTYAVGQYGASVLTAGGLVPLEPIFASTEIVADTRDQAIIGGSVVGDYLAFRQSLGAASFTLFVGGVAVATTGAVTWSAYQPLGIRFSPAAGTITVSGATTGNGTTTGAASAGWTPGTIRMGARIDGTLPAFARFGSVTA